VRGNPVEMDSQLTFEELWQTEFGNVVRTAYLLTGDPEEAADLAQEAFVQTYRRWEDVSRMDRLAAWVQRVVRNLAVSWLRRQRVWARLAARLERAELTAPEPVPDPELMAALAALTPAQRVVLVLRYYCDQSIEDVSDALHKRPGTVRALTSQGLEKMRRILPEEAWRDER
jgi:RNA polymerase sigma-70 factor (sigma-E family)